MRIIQLYISFLLVLSFNSNQSFAIETWLPEAELFTIESGMSQNRVNISFSDSYGFLWVGTSGGLNRYDGYTFKLFKHIPYDSTSLSQNFIRCITEDQNKNLWIGTNYGLNFYDRKTGKFKQYIHNPTESATVSDYRILSVYADRKGFIWIKTEQSIDRLDPQFNSIVHFKHFSRSTQVYPENQNSPILEDKNGILWFGSNDGLFSFNPETTDLSQFFFKPENNQSISDNQVLSIYETKNGQLWVGTKNGVNKYDPVQRNFRRFLYSENEQDNSALNSVYAIIEGPDGYLWLGSNKGIIAFDPLKAESEYLTNLLINKSLYLIGPITGLIMDNSGLIWMSGFEGLYKIDTKPKKFRVYNSTFNSFPFLSGENISCIYKENDDIIWVGERDNGLNMLNRKTGFNTRYYSGSSDKLRQIKSDMVRCIFTDHNGTIWLGSANGLEIFNPDSRTFESFEKKFPLVSSVILNNQRILCIIEDKNQDLWLGTDDGVIRFQRNLKRFTSYNKIFRDSITVKMGLVYAMTTDSENKTWIGTENGLFCYDNPKDLFYAYEETGKKNDLSSRIIYSLHFDSRNTLWVGTASGLNRFNPQNETFELFTEANGLSNDMINAILEDENYCLWLSTNKGMSKYDILKNEFTNFDVTEGLQSYEFNHSVATKANDGEMFFGGISGFNSFYPQNLPLNPHLPYIVITSVKIIDNNSPEKFYSGGEDRFINVKYKQSFTVNFAALDFTFPSSNHFEYSIHLKNGREDWVKIGSQNSVTFSSLSPGEYHLHIRGSNNDRLWNTVGTEMKIVSIAPFWRTRFALYFYFVLIVFLIYLLIQIRTQSLRKTNRILRDRNIASKEISRQKDLLSLRNKNIEDSLNYAQRIQKAMLTNPKQFRSILPDSFVLHKPKDVVTGDFYWISEQDGKIFIAAADCTGHGVPGAFMSIISFELFRKIIKTQKVFNPADILNNMNSNFQEIFGNVEDISIKDGMDLSFCVIDKSMETLEFSGAFNPLYIVRDGNLIELKGDRFSIGADIESDFPLKIFTNHIFELRPNDMIYMFSDGYADQFGGPEGKKYKYLRFRHLLLNLHQLPLDKQRTILEENIDEWKGNLEQIDDIMVIGIRVRK
jgi:ligand-binding sensor domain-containing protein/serine phosphatase RsbU (regulator of sigma subunit)